MPWQARGDALKQSRDDCPSRSCRVRCRTSIGRSQAGPKIWNTVIACPVPQGAAIAPTADYVHQQGQVLTAFRNALWQPFLCAKPGGSRGGHGHARRRHRHQRGHLWGASWRRVRPGRDSRPMDRIACSPAALARIASGRRMRGVGRALDLVRRGGPGGVGYDTDRSGADEVRRPEL